MELKNILVRTAAKLQKLTHGKPSCSQTTANGNSESSTSNALNDLSGTPDFDSGQCRNELWDDVKMHRWNDWLIQDGNYEWGRSWSEYESEAWPKALADGWQHDELDEWREQQSDEVRLEWENRTWQDWEPSALAEWIAREDNL